MAKILKRLFGGRVDARPPSFSGLMYPEDPAELERLVSEALADAESVAPWRAAVVPHSDLALTAPWRAAVVPHSDLALTAAMQASIWKDLPEVEKIMVMAPALRVPFRGVGVISKEGMTTPLGTLEIDHEDYRPLEGSSVVRMQDEAHRVEPGIELQLPWIQARLPDVRVIPLLVGDGPADDVAWVLERLWDDQTALVLACELSTDLSAAEAAARDAETIRRIEALDDSGFAFGDVSGRKPLQALLMLAADRGLEADVRVCTHTGELGGPRERVKGLTAISFDA